MEKLTYILVQITLLLHILGDRSKVFAYGDEAPRCYNPNGRLGVCVSVYECQPLMKTLTKNQPSAYSFISRSACVSYTGQSQWPHICCSSDTGFTTDSRRKNFPNSITVYGKNNVTTTSASKTPMSTMLPRPPFCGPVLTGNKIFGGGEAELGEFPWLANLEYRRPNGSLTSQCAGNIINPKYILTVAHCVVGDIERVIGKLVSVRVGVHNKEVKVDCDDVGCLDPAQRFRVAKAIVHEKYIPTPGTPHDIALVRIDGYMQYSFSVAPICLPNVFPDLPQLSSGAKLSVAGWGNTGMGFSPVKRKVELPYVENKDCLSNVISEQLCAGGEFNEDACTGDSGGGLVRLVKGEAWVVEGLVSYGRGCGLERPAVYTRIRSYIPWIRSNVQP